MSTSTSATNDSASRLSVAFQKKLNLEKRGVILQDAEPSETEDYEELAAFIRENPGPMKTIFGELKEIGSNGVTHVTIHVSKQPTFPSNLSKLASLKPAILQFSQEGNARQFTQEDIKFMVKLKEMGIRSFKTLASRLAAHYVAGWDPAATVSRRVPGGVSAELKNCKITFFGDRLTVQFSTQTPLVLKPGSGGQS